MTDRGVQLVVRRLCDEGWLSIDASAGPRGVNLYRVRGECGSPVNVVRGESERRGGESERTQGVNGVHPNLKKNHQEPSVVEARQRATAKTAIPPDAIISEGQWREAEAKGLSFAEAQSQFSRFRDRALSKGDRYANWDAAWRNWLTSPFFKPITTRGTDAEQFDAHIEALKARVAVQRLE